MGAENTVAMIRDKGGEASCVCVDVTKSADVQQMVKSAVDQYGGLDYAFNNAGFVGSTAGVVETSEEDWQRAVLGCGLARYWTRHADRRRMDGPLAGRTAPIHLRSPSLSRHRQPRLGFFKYLAAA